jgi:Uma2 family endonuclease
VCDASKLDKKGCIGAPDLIVEILLPGNSKREMKEKYEVYEEAGVKAYWLVSLEDKCVLRYILNEEGKFIGLQPLTEDDILTTPIIEGLEIVLKEVFEA